MTAPGLQRSTAIGLAALAASVIILLIPVVIAPIPPIADYPNHLARMWLLSSDASLASVSQFYRLQFDTFTNVGIDLLALTVGKVAGYQIAGRLSVAAAVVLPSLGGALFWRSVHGRYHWWMLSFGLLAWGQSLLDAFLNFQIGIGLALIFAALEPSVGTRKPAMQILLRALMSLALLLMHPFALLFHAFLLGALSIGPAISGRSRQYWTGIARRLAPVFLSTGLVVLVFVLTVPSLPGAQEHSGLNTLHAEFSKGFQQFGEEPVGKLLDLLFAMRAYSNRVDLPTALAFFAPVGLAALMLRLRLHAGLTLLSAGLLAAYFLCPDYLLGAYWVDTRFAVMFPFALAAAVVPDLPRGAARIAASVLVVAFIGRTALIGSAWWQRQSDVASVARALQAVPAGASILPVEQRPADRSIAPPGRYTVVGENSFRHLATLAIPWRQAFVPTLFAARGKQPVAVQAPWDDIAEPNGGQLADVHALDPAVPFGAGLDFARYATVWRTRFDYVLVVNADMPDRFGPFTPPPALTLVRDAGFAKLYRITPAATPTRPARGGQNAAELPR